MTSARSTIELLSTEDARAQLQAAGLRCTSARISVLKCLHSTAKPLTPAEVLQDLRAQGFDRSTIYRALAELDDVRLAMRLDLGDGIRRYEKRSTEDIRHPHFLCTDCGVVQCLSGFTVELHADRRGSLHPGQISEVLMRGHCADCLP